MEISPGAIEKENVQYDVADFDELENLESAPAIDPATLQEDVTPTPPKVDEKTAEVPVKDEESIDPIGDDAEDDVDPQEKKDEKDIEDVDKMSPKDEDAEFRTLKLKDGKDLVEVSQDATFKFKIDGEFVNPSVNDLVEYYQRNKAVDRRFEDANDLNQKAQSSIKKHESQVGKVTQYATSFMENVKEGHMRDAIYDLCRITGQDPEDQWDSFRQIQMSSSQKLSEMTQEEIESASLKEENDFYRRQNSKKETEEQIKTQKESQRLEVLESCNQWGILEDTFKRGEEYVNNLIQTGKMDPARVNASVKAEVGFDLTTLDLIDQTVSREFPEKKGNWDLYNEILKDTKERGLTMDDWTKIIRNAKNGSQKQERRAAIKRKVAKAKPTQPSAPKETQEDDTIDWDAV